MAMHTAATQRAGRCKLHMPGRRGSSSSVHAIAVVPLMLLRHTAPKLHVCRHAWHQAHAMLPASCAAPAPYPGTSSPHLQAVVAALVLNTVHVPAADSVLQVLGKKNRNETVEFAEGLEPPGMPARQLQAVPVDRAEMLKSKQLSAFLLILTFRSKYTDSSPYLAWGTTVARLHPQNQNHRQQQVEHQTMRPPRHVHFAGWKAA